MKSQLAVPPTKRSKSRERKLATRTRRPRPLAGDHAQTMLDIMFALPANRAVVASDHRRSFTAKAVLFNTQTKARYSTDVHEPRVSSRLLFFCHASLPTLCGSNRSSDLPTTMINAIGSGTPCLTSLPFQRRLPPGGFPTDSATRPVADSIAPFPLPSAANAPIGPKFLSNHIVGRSDNAIVVVVAEATRRLHAEFAV